MKKITIHTRTRVSKKRWDLIYKVAEYCLKDLKLPEIHIYVELAADMGNNDGLCWGKKFIDIVNKRNENALIDTIAHEMRHCWQHFYKVYSMSDKLYKTMNYNNIPWEKDAMEYGSKVVNHFKRRK